MTLKTDRGIFIPNTSFSTPVLFLIFNRPDTTKQVFSAIKKVKPPRLYVAADGPRSDYPNDAESCEIARSIATNVDWDCEVKTFFRENNLGCKLAASQAIDWFFEQELEGIILEDDCLPDQSFFWFCQELLGKYRDDTRIMHISGTNFQFGKERTKYSYYFSRYTHLWGWASWRRAWKYYDVKLKQWPEGKKNEILLNWADDRRFINFWEILFEKAASGNLDTWDPQWIFTCWSQNGLSVVPSVNLVSNLGFSKDSTHTQDVKSPLAYMSTKAITFPMEHPNHIVRHWKADRYVECQQFSRPPLSRLLQKFKRLIRWRDE